jgi:hypothetical protein
VEKLTGGCLCGKVKFEILNDFSQFHLCHCTQCQRISGSAHVSNLFSKPEHITWLSGHENMKHFDYPNRNVSRTFCTECGTGLPYPTKTGKTLIVPAGSLDADPDNLPNIAPQDNIFWSERASWYDAAILTPRFDGFPK